MTILNPNFKQTAKEKKLINIFNTLTSGLELVVINQLNDIQRVNYKKNLIIPISSALRNTLHGDLLEAIKGTNTTENLGLSKHEMLAWQMLLSAIYIPNISNLCGLNVHFDFKELSIRGLYNICMVHLISNKEFDYTHVPTEKIKSITSDFLDQLDLLTAYPISEEKRKSILYYLPVFFKTKINASEYESSPCLIKPLKRISLEESYETEQILVLSDLFHERIVNPHLNQNVCSQPNNVFVSYLTAKFPKITIDQKKPYLHLPIGSQYHFNSFDYTDHILSTLSQYIKAKHGDTTNYQQVGILPLGFCSSLIALSSFSAKVIIDNDRLVKDKPTTFSSSMERVDWREGNLSDNIKWVTEYLIGYYGGGYGGLLIKNDYKTDAMIKDFVITDLKLILRFIKVSALSEIDIDMFVDEVMQSIKNKDSKHSALV